MAARLRPIRVGNELASSFRVFRGGVALTVALGLLGVAWYALFSRDTHDQSRYIEARLLRTFAFDVAVRRSSAKWPAIVCISSGSYEMPWSLEMWRIGENSKL
jgi:hypothetical protein